MKNSIWLLALCLALFPLGSMAEVNPLPPEPAGLKTIMEGECKDMESNEMGYCKSLVDAEGNFYMVFKQDNVIQFIRKVIGTGYVEIWSIKGAPI